MRDAPAAATVNRLSGSGMEAVCDAARTIGVGQGIASGEAT